MISFFTFVQAEETEQVLSRQSERHSWVKSMRIVKQRICEPENLLLLLLLLLLAASLMFLGVFPHSFEEHVSIYLLHQETQLPEGGVVGRAAPLQRGHQLLVLGVLLQKVPDGEDGPLAHDLRRSLRGTQSV